MYQDYSTQSPQMGYVYLLHFDKPISPGRHTCQHYLGWAGNLAARLQQHRLGQGSRLCQVAKERGIGFSLVRVWPGSRELERRLKNRKEGPRLCPCCSGEPHQLSWLEMGPAELAEAEWAF
jgi:predicted GIY-YIG superfamily endonuclease